ncbi:MAG: radical SAM protein [Eggerthellaceae bacterium]|nr:radical SAM protein [Eggerthellaceae bacterium]
MSIARQISECGIPAVSLTGGEPLIRPDFFEIVEALTNEGVCIDQLYTNGVLLDEEVLRGSEQLGQHPVIIISYGGVGFHDWVRGVPGAERMADRAIWLCKDAGFAVRCQMRLYRDNSTALRTTINHLAKLGCDAVRIGVMTDRGNWLANGRDMTLSPREFFELGLRCIRDYYEDGMPVMLELSNMFAATPDLPDVFWLLPYQRRRDGDDALYFSCARRSLQIYPDARPAAYDKIDASFLELDPIAADDPSLRTVPLSTLLSSGSAYMDLLDMRCSKALEMGSPCSTCKYYTVCLGGCHAQAHEAFGSIYERDPVACEFWAGGTRRAGAAR